MNETPSLYNFSRQELGPFLKALGAPSYAGTQVFRWLYRQRVGSLEEMTDLSKEFRATLAAQAVIQPLRLVDKQESADGTVKYGWEAAPDAQGRGGTVESVLIPMKFDEDGEPGSHTACLSTQAGCRMKCSFCATGVPKFQRNLTTGEILGQILGMERESGIAFHNVVVMGMGEPLDNYDATLRAMRVLNDPEGLNLGRRRITVSTSGLVDPLVRFLKDDWPATLALSLHSAIPDKRNSLVPINKANPLEKLRKILRDYTFVRRLPVTLEYILLAGVNDGPEDAEALAAFCQDLMCKVNLIRYNPVPTLPYHSPDEDAIFKFQGRLKAKRVRAFLRERKGVDIAAACGQLGFGEGAPGGPTESPAVPHPGGVKP